ncbi:MAG: serine/threonine protein kinase [Kiritimatiellaeota bacterium]|nr:serine/threonine protein kinase [Kiritimatiellota bacterium]
MPTPSDDPEKSGPDNQAAQLSPWDECPETIGRFPIESLIGEGAFGRVYRAYHPEFEVPVAVKVLAGAAARKPGALERFRREAQMAARIRHQNVVNVFEYGLDGRHDRPFIVMEYVEGPNLSDALDDRGGRLDSDEAVRIVTEIAAGLREFEKRGIVHRDVKPANIILTDDGAKLADMGLARRLNDDAALTTTREVVGTPHYMSPEQVRDPKHLDARSDIYSLGATFYHMVTGVYPFEGETAHSVIMRLLREKPRPARRRAPDVPRPVSEVIARMMAKEPGERYQTIDRLLEALRALQTPAEATPASGLRQSQRHRRRAVERGRAKRIPWRGLAAGIALLLLAGGGVWAMSAAPVSLLPVWARIALWTAVVVPLPWGTPFLTRWAVTKASNTTAAGLLSGYTLIDLGLAVKLLRFGAGPTENVWWMLGALIAALIYNYWACERIAARQP